MPGSVIRTKRPSDSPHGEVDNRDASHVWGFGSNVPWGRLIRVAFTVTVAVGAVLMAIAGNSGD